MIVKSRAWYHPKQAKDCSVISCYALKLHDKDRGVCDGYYYCGRFYIGQEDRTDYILSWMIPKEGESVRPN